MELRSKALEILPKLYPLLQSPGENNLFGNEVFRGLANPDVRLLSLLLFISQKEHSGFGGEDLLASKIYASLLVFRMSDEPFLSFSEEHFEEMFNCLRVEGKNHQLRKNIFKTLAKGPQAPSFDKLTSMLQTEQNPYVLEGVLQCMLQGAKAGTFDLSPLPAFLHHLGKIQTRDAFHLQAETIKVYTATQYQMDSQIQIPYEIIFEILSVLPPSNCDDDDTQQCYWRAKKWAIKMMNARRIDAKLRVPVVKVLVGLLEAGKMENGPPVKILCLSMSILSRLIDSTSVRKSLGDSFLFSLVELLPFFLPFPMHYLEKWREDPIDFLKGMDAIEVFTRNDNLQNPASHLYQSIIIPKPGKENKRVINSKLLAATLNSFIPYFLTFSKERGLDDARMVHGMVHVFGQLLIDYDVFKNAILPVVGMITERVVPLFLDPQIRKDFPFLAAKMCDTIPLHPEILPYEKFFDLCLELWDHPDLPLRFQAARTLGKLCQEEEALPLFRKDFEKVVKIVSFMVGEDGPLTTDAFEPLRTLLQEEELEWEEHSFPLFKVLAARFAAVVEGGMEGDDDEIILSELCDCINFLPPRLKPTEIPLALSLILPTTLTFANKFHEHDMEPILLFLSAFPCALFDASLFPFPPSLWEFYFELMRMGSTLGRGEVGEDGRVGRQWTTQIFDFIRDLFDDRETLEGEKGGLIVTVLARFVHRCGDHFDGEIERTACFRFVTDIMRKIPKELVVHLLPVTSTLLMRPEDFVEEQDPSFAVSLATLFTHAPKDLIFNLRGEYMDVFLRSLPTGTRTVKKRDRILSRGLTSLLSMLPLSGEKKFFEYFKRNIQVLIRLFKDRMREEGEGGGGEGEGEEDGEEEDEAEVMEEGDLGDDFGGDDFGGDDFGGDDFGGNDFGGDDDIAQMIMRGADFVENMNFDGDDDFAGWVDEDDEDEEEDEDVVMEPLILFMDGLVRVREAGALEKMLDKLGEEEREGFEWLESESQRGYVKG